MMETGVKLSQWIFIFLWLFFSVADGNRMIFSSKGELCLSECDREGFDFICRTTASTYGLCSPMPGVASSGESCTGPCQKEGYCGTFYYWCKTKNSWNYCSPLVTTNKLIRGSYGGICVDNCAKSTGSYAYCTTTYGEWDYCSTSDQHGAYGYPCSGPCIKTGSYRYCYTATGSWDYCSENSELTPTILTRDGFFCISPCVSHHDSYYYCITFTGWGYCSPEPGKTYKGKNCRQNNWCDKRGKTYYWCWTDDSSWDYCSPHIDCSYWPYYPDIHGRKKRAIKDICTVNDQGNNMVTKFFEAEDARHRITDITRKNKMVNDFNNIIAEFGQSFFESGIGAKTVIRSELLRIDIQGFFNKDGVKFANIQVQINGVNSKTVAQLAVRANTYFPIRYIRKGLHISMASQRGIFLDVQRM